jgi:FKBP-type peptidyl-prolyl cis-trans isomerase
MGLRGCVGLGLLLAGSLLPFGVGGCEGQTTGPAATRTPADSGNSSSAPASSVPQTPPDVKAAPGDAKTTSSGLAWKVLIPGTGTIYPGPTDTVTVHYTGWTTDGRMFDSSEARGVPAVFPLNGVIKGWTEGVQLMVEGERSRFWIPAELAYGNTPPKGYPAGLLVFEIALIKIGS